MSRMMKGGSRRRCVSSPGIFFLFSSVFTLLIIITTRLQMITTTNNCYQHQGRQRQPPLTVRPPTVDTTRTREESEDSRRSTIRTTTMTCQAHPPWPASRTVPRSGSPSSQEGQLCPTCWCWCSRSVISYHCCIVSFKSFSFTQFTSLPSSNTLLLRFLNSLATPLVITRSTVSFLVIFN